MSGFRKATKTAAKLRLALIGPPGSGKTYTGIGLACCLGQKVAVIFQFDVLELADSFHPKRYIEAIREAAEAGYDALVIDSLSHAWIGKDGGLDLHDQAVNRQRTKNSFTAWGEVTPHHMALIEAITQSPLHLIATMRSKVEYAQDKDANGKPQVRKVGTAPLMRDGAEYEFDVVAEMDQDNRLVVTKTRCPALAGHTVQHPGRALANTIKTWLGTGPTPAPTPAPQPAPAPKPAERQPGEDDDAECINESQQAELKRIIDSKDRTVIGAVKWLGLSEDTTLADLTLDQYARIVEHLSPKTHRAPQHREPAPAK